MIENFEIDSNWRVAVTSRSFSRNEALRARLVARYPNATFNDEGLRLEGEELVTFLEGHEMAITALEVVDEVLLSRLPDLKIVSKYGVGTDMIDLAALHRHGVRFGWRGGVNARAVSELVVAFAIMMLRQLPRANQEVRAGGWRQIVGGQLSGRTFGIVGLGHVGKDLVQMLHPFGCRILAHDIVSFPEFCGAWKVEEASLATLMREADLVTLHVPLDSTTRGMIGEAQLQQMKPGSYLINAARGGLIDETALAQALGEDHIAGVALDVLSVEPPENNALLDHPRVFVTPHIGGSSQEAILAMGQAAIDGLGGAREALPENFS